MRILPILIFTFFVSLPSVYAQTNDTIDYVEEGEYITKYKNRVTAKLFYVNTFNSYVFSDRDSGLKFEMEPNKQNKIGGNVSYSFITLGYSFAPDFLAENKDNEDSKLFNISLRMFPGKWMQFLEIYKEKGFYETDNFNIYLPETNSLKIGGSTSYILNDNFSFRAISNQDEKQVKSAGSFIPGISYYYSKFNVVGESAEGRVDEDFHSVDLAFVPSYYYNFIPVEDLMLSAGVGAGIGLNYSKSDDEKLTSLLTEWNAAATVTYDLDDFYLGSQFRYQVLKHNTDRSTYTEDNIPYFQFFVGYRFNAPSKWIKAKEDLLNRVKKDKNGNA